MHEGCPVVHGNKWIANKWVKRSDQMWHYPCLLNKEPFTINMFLKSSLL